MSEAQAGTSRLCALGDLPDGTERYLVDLEALIAATDRLGGELLDPIKTTNVQGRRCMTTWVVRKGGGPVTDSLPST